MTKAVFGEIQGLRALAVTLVVVFHIWPQALPGGYVGVDVFFVISGYLITGSLARQADRHGKVDLLDFYNRRIRRLLPAATTTLGFAAVGTILFMPETRWSEIISHIVAGAFYMENWLLAREAVDYLAADNAPTPVQHFWSLAVEEQFYLVWPVLIAAGLFVAKARKLNLRIVLVVLLGTVFLTSLVLSAVLSAQTPATAFFVTHTRMWELALGGLLALGLWGQSLIGKRALAAFLAGVISVALAAGLYSEQINYPGLYALLPTAGAALIIASGDVSIGAFRGLNFSYARWIGDRSYSIYLWHWPIVIFYTATHPSIDWLSGVGIAAFTLALSELSYRFIEQPFRHPREKWEWLPASLSFTSLATFAVAGLLSQQWIASQSVSLQNGDPNYPGPAALLYQAAVPADVPIAPTLTDLKDDLPVIYDLGCHQTLTEAAVLVCRFGSDNPGATIAVVGDSHAANWIPALERIALSQNWQLLSITKSSCGVGDLTNEPSCTEWQEGVQAMLLAERPRYAFFSRFNHGNAEAAEASLIQSWPLLEMAGIGVIAIVDTPRMQFEPGDCLSLSENVCSTPRTAALSDDPLKRAAEAVEGVTLVDLNDAICGVDSCDAVVGNLIVYRDAHHLTSTYSAALAPFLSDRASVGDPVQVAQIDTAVLGIRAALLTNVPSVSEPSAAAETETPPANNETAPAIKVAQAEIVLETSETETQLTSEDLSGAAPKPVSSSAESTTPLEKYPPARMSFAVTSRLVPPTMDPNSTPVRVKLECGPTGPLPSFERTTNGRLSGEQFVLERGVRDKNGYELWLGALDIENLTMLIVGEYIEGDDGIVKAISMSAESEDGHTFTGTGNRGPRTCSVTIGVNN